MVTKTSVVGRSFKLLSLYKVHSIILCSVSEFISRFSLPSLIKIPNNELSSCSFSSFYFITEFVSYYIVSIGSEMFSAIQLYFSFYSFLHLHIHTELLPFSLALYFHKYSFLKLCMYYDKICTIPIQYCKIQ